MACNFHPQTGRIADSSRIPPCRRSLRSMSLGLAARQVRGAKDAHAGARAADAEFAKTLQSAPAADVLRCACDSTRAAALAPSGAPGAGAAKKAQTTPNNLLKKSKIVVGNQCASASVGPGVAFLGERAILEPNPWEEGTQCVTTPWHTFLTDWP